MYISPVDDFIWNIISKISNPILTYFFAIVTYSGGYMVATLVTTLTACAFIIHNRKNEIAPLLLSVAGASLSVFLLKHFFDLDRPYQALYIESTPSFPSGHSAIAIALYGFLLISAWRHDKHHLQNPFIFFLIILILLIGISRIYLGVHFFADVVFGYIVGIIWLFIGSKFGKYKKSTL